MSKVLLLLSLLQLRRRCRLRQKATGAQKANEACHSCAHAFHCCIAMRIIERTLQSVAVVASLLQRSLMLLLHCQPLQQWPHRSQQAESEARQAHVHMWLNSNLRNLAMVDKQTDRTAANLQAAAEKDREREREGRGVSQRWCRLQDSMRIITMTLTTLQMQFLYSLLRISSTCNN